MYICTHIHIYIQFTVLAMSTGMEISQKSVFRSSFNLPFSREFRQYEQV